MRIASIDTLKAVAIFAVVCIHTQPLTGNLWSLGVIINQASRFAVPFFFIISGYFYAKKLQESASKIAVFLTYSKRLFMVFLIWSAIYLVYPFNYSILKSGIVEGEVMIIHQRIALIADNPLIFLLQGTASHLWFLPSLIISYFILLLLSLVRREDKILYIVILLYLFGLLGGSYADTPIGIYVPFNTRNGPFFGTLFVGIGYFLAKSNYKATVKLAYFSIIAGFLLHMIEVLILFKYFHVHMIEHNYLLGTVLFGTGFAFLALAKPELGKDSLLPYWGTFTLGVYVSHLLIAKTLGEFKTLVPALLWEPFYPFCVYFISLWLTMALSKRPYMRRAIA